MLELSQKQSETDSEPPLRLTSLKAGYNGTPIVSDLDVELKPGEKVLLVGPNGCGKSTLIKAIIGQARVLQGDVLINGKSVLGLPTEKRILMGVAYLPQQRNVFASLSVQENLLLSHMYLGKIEKRKVMELVMHTFPFLEKKLGARAGTLSGGERQALAMGMTVHPEAVVYLLDEPCAGLSPKAAGAVLEGMRALDERFGISCIIVEHNLRYVSDWVDRAVVMSNGRIVDETTEMSGLLQRKTLERHFFQEA